MAAPQLRLDVSLNLSGFRGEIQKLTNIAQSEFVPKINIKFNRRTLDTELNNLQAAIKRRVYRVEIGGNIDKLPDKIRGLKEQLSSLENFKIDLGIGAVKSLSKKDAKDIANGLRAQILGEQTKLYMPVSIKPSVTREDVRNFKNTVKSKLTGLSVDVKANVQGAGFAGTKSGAAGLMEYMQKEGLLGKTASGMTMQMGKDSGEIKRQLNEAVQSAEKIKSVFDGVAKNIATTGKSIANIQGKRIGLQNVPLMAGSVEKRVERSASAIGSTTSFDTLKALYPEISKTIVSFAALRGQIQQNASKLSGFSLIIGLAAFAGVPLAKSIVKLTGSADSFTKLLDKLGPKLEIAFAKAASNILNTASSRLLSGGSVAGLLPAAYRGIGPSAGPAGLLPPAYRGIEPSRSTGALPPAYRGLPFGFDFKGLPPGGSGGDKGGSLGPTIQQMREQLFSSVRIAEARVREIFDIVADFDSRQKAAGQARLDKAVQDFVKGLEDITRRAILRGGVRQVNVADLGGAVRPALPSGRSPLMLPPAGGTTATGRIRVSTGAYLGQPGFMQAPSVPSPAGGGGTPPLPPRGGGGGGAFGGMQFNMPQLPGAGLVREIGEEFGFAAKQVLLFGTAYKALAFLQSFPGQVGDAVGALQSFRNTIKEISPSAQEAANSSQFILDIVDKYNTPLQSARDGFVKLYASMQPAGFSGNEIRDLFLGISQTAATFGMSADKVDRVNYAFAQMASKGQVMSEELKGQLGDVLPGAMAIFAEAAGFKGPEAITKFSKALEDGAYKGGAMKTLLTNVGSIMRKEFGPGAEGAARTFQGVMNRMQNSTKLLYEAFEPVAIGFLNSVVMPLTSGLKTVTDGFNAFFTGVNAKTSGGFAFAQELEKLRPTFEGLRTNAIGLAQVFGEFAKVALGVGSALLQIAGNPIVGFMAKIYAIMVPLNMALGVMRGLWALNSLQLLLFNARVAMGVPTLSAFRGMMQATGATAAVTAKSIRTAGLTLRTFFASTGVGLILVGISLLIERFMGMNQALADTRAKALGAAQAIRSMTKTEAILDERKTVSAIKLLETLQTRKRSYEGSTDVSLTKSEASLLEDVGVPVNKGGFGGGQYMNPTMLESQKQRLETVNLAELRHRQRVISNDENEAKQAAAITPITGLAGDGTAAGKGKGADKLDTYNRSTLDFIKLRLEAEKQSLDQRRQAGLLSETGYKIAVAELELESSKEEVAERLRLSRIAINQDNLSAADKALKLKDTEIIAERELSIAANKRNIAVEGARKELEGPFNDAIDSANFSIMEQQMLLENIRNGIQDLTPDQQAYLQVLRLTTGMGEDELKLLVAKSNVTRQILEQDIAIKKQVDFEQKLRGLREEIKLLLIVNDAESRLAELRNEYDGDAVKAQQIFNLEEVKRNIEATRALISDFVSSTASDYKGFLKAVISGEDAVDALKQFQAGLTDKVLTIFLDFTMAPVEKFFKESLGNLFLPKAENIPGLDVAKEVTKDPVQATNSNTNATVANTAALEKVAGVLTGTSLSPSTSELGSTLSTNVTGTIENVTEQTKAEGIKFSESLGKTVGAIGIAAGSIMGIAAGIGQIKEGGTSNVLGGIGSVLMSLGGAVGGFAGLLKGANGGVAGGGWKPFPVTAFANGGMVNGPTLGLVGEGKYNEAIVPLPDGRSIPVQMKGGGGGLREAMSGSNGRASGSPILNMSFQSTNINGVEYVSRDQLEAAMAQTRKQASRDGANRGMSMTLDKLQQSPQTRNRLGMR
jgi:tape measure domain-containing protein